MTYLELVAKIENKRNFSFSRFGDGEFNCMFGKTGANCDGHKYYRDLGERLIEAWNEPKGICAVQPYALRLYEDQLGGIDWTDADILHRASIKGELDLFFDASSVRRVIIVGPRHLRMLGPDWHLIEVPPKNAWLSYADTLEEVNRLVQPNDVVLLCCGMMAEVLIWDMYAEDITLIDCGSVFDPYCGVRSRQYHHKLEI